MCVAHFAFGPVVIDDEKEDEFHDRWIWLLSKAAIGEPKSQTDGHCIAAVVGKNPGSARPTKGQGWQAVELAGDKMLPTIKNGFLAAYARAALTPPEFAYVQILNLFYLCHPQLKKALKIHHTLNNSRNCEKENQPYEIVWFVWGGDHDKLNELKKRFRKSPIRHPFFYNKANGQNRHHRAKHQ